MLNVKSLAGATRKMGGGLQFATSFFSSSSLSPSSSSRVTELPADQLPGLSLEQINKIAQTDQALRQRHIKIEGDIKSEAERDEVRRKRMIYRSKQRG